MTRTAYALDGFVKARIERATVAAREDRRVFDILDMLAKCPECVGDSPSGAVFGCESCLEQLSRDVMES